MSRNKPNDTGWSDSLRGYFHKAKRPLLALSLAGIAGAGKCYGDENRMDDTERRLEVFATPSDQRIGQRSSGTYTLTVRRVGFTGDVTLSKPVSATYPSDVSIVFTPTVLKAGDNSATAVVSVGPNAPIEFNAGLPLSRSLRIEAASGDLKASTDLSLAIMPSSTAGVTMDITPSAFNINVGETKEATIKLARQGGYTGTVAMSVTGTLPGVTTSITPVAGLADSYTLRFATTAQTTQQGDAYTYKVRATPAGLDPVEASVSVLITRPNFSMVLRQSPRIRSGGQDTVSVILQRSGGLTAPITLSIDSARTGITGTFSPNPAVDDASVLTLRVAETVPPGSYLFKIRGEPAAGSGASPETKTFALDVDAAAPVASYTLLPPNVTLSAGTTSGGTFGVNRVNGFAPAVNVGFTLATGAPLPSGLAVSLVQNPVQGAATAMNVNAAFTLAPGRYDLKANGTVAGSNAVVSAPFTVTVNELPRAQSITVVKTVNGVQTATTSEDITTGAQVELIAVVRDQNGNPISNAPVTWSSGNTAVALVGNSGAVIGVGVGTATVTVKSDANNAVTANVGINVTAPIAGKVSRIALQPQAVEMTAPAKQTFVSYLYDPTGARLSVETGGSIEYIALNPTIATVNATTGVVTAIGEGRAVIRARYVRNGIIVAQDNSAITVYPPTAGHFNSAEVSISGNIPELKKGVPKRFQVFLYDALGNQRPPAASDSVKAEPLNNTAITVTPESISGGHFFTMTATSSAVVGATYRIRYDAKGVGGEIIITIVP